MIPYNISNIFAHTRLVFTRHVTEYDSAKIGEYLSDIPQFPKLQGSKFAKNRERFAFVTEEEINLLVDKAV